jgi:hypothetical protein
MTDDQVQRILGHLKDWSKHAFDEFSADELERAADQAEHDGDYAAAARLRNRAYDKRVLDDR